MNSSDHGAWLRVAVADHEGRLVLYATRILGDPERARDVVQEVFLRLCREPRETVEPALLPWLCAVCRNAALDVLRKERPMVPIDETAERRADGGSPSPAAILQHAETASDVVQAVGALPDRQQEVVRLKFQQGLSYREIAQVTGLSVTNVGFIIHGALKTLRARLGGGRMEGVLS